MRTGYHRLWSHTSYSAILPIQIFLALVGGGAIQGSIRWWSRNHRAHHRYTDTLKDPYSVQLGILYSHMGWMIFKQNPQKIGRVDISDINNDPVVIWQHRNFLSIALGMGFVFPCVVAGLGWGELDGRTCLCWDYSYASTSSPTPSSQLLWLTNDNCRSFCCPTSHLLCQLARSLARRSTFRWSKLTSRPCHYRPRDSWRRLPQFPPWVPSRLSQCYPVVPIRSYKMVNLSLEVPWSGLGFEDLPSERDREGEIAATTKEAGSKTRNDQLGKAIGRLASFGVGRIRLKS